MNVCDYQILSNIHFFLFSSLFVRTSLQLLYTMYGAINLFQVGSSVWPRVSGSVHTMHLDRSEIDSDYMQAECN